MMKRDDAPPVKKLEIKVKELSQEEKDMIMYGMAELVDYNDKFKGE